MSIQPRGSRPLLAGALGIALVAAPALSAPAFALVGSGGVFINEIHYDNASTDVGEAIEVAAVEGTDLTGWSVVLYNGSNGAVYGTHPLPGTVGASSTIVVNLPTNGLQNGSPDGIALVDASSVVVEFLSYEGEFMAVGGPADGLLSSDIGVAEGSTASVGQSLQRVGTGETADDFSFANAAASSFGSLNAGQTFAGNSGGGGEVDVETLTIAEIQGEGAASPHVGATVTTAGVVTAAYPSGGYNGYFLQTAGTGGALDLAAHTASHGIFVWSPATVGSVSVGDYIEITGEVSEFSGLTEITVSSGDDLEQLDPATAAGVIASAVPLPADAAVRESLEGMLLMPAGDYTVTNSYITNQYAEIGLASGTSPLITPTELARPGTAEYDVAVADNIARAVSLDDGASINFFSGANQDIPLPWLSTSAPISVGSPVTFTSPVIFDFRNNTWKFQPTSQLTVGNAAAVQPAQFGDVRPGSPDDVGGAIQLAGFNVLNYFTTTGDELSGCQYYTDRDGNPISVRTGCAARGAADDANLARQQAKIVNAINSLGADVVALEEIENSAVFGKMRDQALIDLVEALNAALGDDTWMLVPSPAAVPENEDVIRTAFIYKPALVELVGESSILLGSPAFVNAREPLAQAFVPVGAKKESGFIAIANHFKSKGSGSGADADQGDGQGASNASRVAQATALVAFADGLQDAMGLDKVFLVGDFNSYTQEDPMQVFYDAGYINQGAKTGEYSYSFRGTSGSLDHILASPSADQTVTGVDVWNINAGEPVALEYSRFNYNVTNFYDESVYRSSDHDPVIVGIGVPASPSDLVQGVEDAIQVQAPSVEPGSELTVTVGAAYDGAMVSAWLYSPATQLGGWREVAPDGTISVTIPDELPPANYRLAVLAANGDVIGWTELKVVAHGQQ